MWTDYFGIKVFFLPAEPIGLLPPIRDTCISLHQRSGWLDSLTTSQIRNTKKIYFKTNLPSTHLYRDPIHRSDNTQESTGWIWYMLNVFKWLKLCNICTRGQRGVNIGHGDLVTWLVSALLVLHSLVDLCCACGVCGVYKYIYSGPARVVWYMYKPVPQL